MILKLLMVISLVGIYLYWSIAEKKQSNADLTKGQHRPFTRQLIRAAMPLAGLLLGLQLIGVVTLPAPVPSGLARHLFWVGQVILWGGVLLAIWARRTIGVHWAHAAEYQVMPDQRLITAGPYHYIRHPIYTSLLLLVLGVELALTSWLIGLVIPLIVFFIWQANKEEQLLIQIFGNRYKEYQKKTGQLLPRWIFSSN